MVEDGKILTKLITGERLLHIARKRLHDVSCTLIHSRIQHRVVHAHRLQHGCLHSGVEHRDKRCLIATESCGNRLRLDAAQEIDSANPLLQRLQLFSPHRDHLSTKRVNFLLLLLSLPQPCKGVERGCRRSLLLLLLLLALKSSLPTCRRLHALLLLLLSLGRRIRSASSTEKVLKKTHDHSSSIFRSSWQKSLTPIQYAWSWINF